MTDTIISVAAYGAKGDGITDDGPAIQRALAAVSSNGGNARIVFEKKTYRIGKLSNGTLLDLRSLHDVRIDGNGAVFLNDPNNNLVALSRCTNVSVGGFTLECDPLSFSQGTIIAVNADEGTFDVELHRGYLNWAEALREKRIAGVSIGMIMQSDAPLRKKTPNAGDFVRLESSVTTAAGMVRVTLPETQRKQLIDTAPGDRFVVTFYYGGQGANFSMISCLSCEFHDITVYSAKFGMTFAVSKSLDRAVLRRIVIKRKPGTDRLLATPKDGMHCKENRVGPLIEDCWFEGLLDDSINVSVCPYWVKEIIDERTVMANAGPPLVGDRIMAYNPGREDLGYYRVVAVEPYQKPGKRSLWQKITFDKPVVDFDIQPSDNDFPGGPEKLKCTGLYNLDACGSGYIVRNCTFKEQRRFAILGRPSGTIENNLMESTGGSAMHLGNEIGSFYEGPMPQNLVIRGNTVRNVLSHAIVVFSSTMLREPLAHTILIESNSIESLYGNALRVSCASNVRITGNRITVNEKTPLDAAAVHLDNCRAVSMDANGITDPRTVGAAVTGSDTREQDMRKGENKFTLAGGTSAFALEPDPPAGLIMPKKPRYLAVQGSGLEEIPFAKSPYRQVFTFRGSVTRGSESVAAYEVHPPFAKEITSGSLFFGDRFDVADETALRFYAAKMNAQGDGVIVKLAFRASESERWKEVFSQKITEETWRQFEVDITPWQEKTVFYRFEVNSGANTAFDNAVVGGVQKLRK
ncbi:MAG: right-handed parallel beta-helix repeat-containing protein [Spirochaetes bacterium]|nr:right-handed parallel beta-helix repeat-containing protein [Spirochaetota bacterium]